MTGGTRRPLVPTHPPQFLAGGKHPPPFLEAWHGLTEDFLELLADAGDGGCVECRNGVLARGCLEEHVAAAGIGRLPRQAASARAAVASLEEAVSSRETRLQALVADLQGQVQMEKACYLELERQADLHLEQAAEESRSRVVELESALSEERRTAASLQESVASLESVVAALQAQLSERSQGGERTLECYLELQNLIGGFQKEPQGTGRVPTVELERPRAGQVHHIPCTRNLKLSTLNPEPET